MRRRRGYDVFSRHTRNCGARSAGSPPRGMRMKEDRLSALISRPFDSTEVRWLGRECPDKTLLLGVSVRVFPDDISIWTGALSEAHCPLPVRGLIKSTERGGGIDEKDCGGGNLRSLPDCWAGMSAFCPLFLKTFLGLQLAGGRWWDLESP